MVRPHVVHPHCADEHYAAADRDNRGCKTGSVHQNMVNAFALSQ
jgi:hypothetical protein